jgi:hypothetical protein
MPFLQQGNRYPEQDDDGKQMPFMFLHRHGTIVKKIPHDDIEKNVRRHQQEYDRQTPAQQTAHPPKKTLQLQQHACSSPRKTFPI